MEKRTVGDLETCETSSSESLKEYILYLEDEGRLTLPDEVLQKLEVQKGERLILKIEENGIMQLVSLRQQVRKMRGILKDIAPELSLVDELIQERREEAARE